MSLNDIFEYVQKYNRNSKNFMQTIMNSEIIYSAIYSEEIYSEEIYSEYEHNNEEIYSEEICKTINGCYWLGGQVRITLSEPITNELIEEVRIKNEEAYNLLGDPCNSWEAGSMMNHQNNFDTLQMIRNEYNSHKNHKKSVQIIEKYWLAYIMNPANEICKRRLMREYLEILDDNN